MTKYLPQIPPINADDSAQVCDICGKQKRHININKALETFPASVFQLGILDY